MPARRPTSSSASSRSSRTTRSDSTRRRHGGASSASGFANLTPTQAGGPQCGLSLGSNVKVNQGCLNITAPNLQGRGQAHNETTIAVNPANPNELVGASNDYSLGDGLAGGTSYSKDGGRTWQDSTLPVEFTRGSDFAGDPYPADVLAGWR